MPLARYLTHCDRAYRRERVIAAYQRGGSSRSVAASFGLSDSYVRGLIVEAGVSRPPGRPGAKRTDGHQHVHVGIPDSRASYEGRPCHGEAA